MSVNEQVRYYLSQIRRRFQVQTAARGLAVCGVVALLGTVAAVLGADAWRFSEMAVGVASAFLWVAVGVAVILFLALPLIRRISDARIARFVEEKHPEFCDRLVTAVDLGEKSSTAANVRLFQELVAEDALKRTPSASPHTLIERQRILRPLVWAAGSVAVILLLGFLGPGIFRYGTKVLWVGWAQAKVNPLYQIQVKPGDIVIGRNTDQEIIAQPVGFLPEAMRLFVLYAKNPGWESAPMLPDERGGSFHFLLMNLQEPIQYYVESNGVRSTPHRISVIDVPRAERLEVRYHYPAYSGLADVVESPGGDIVAWKGTQVTLTVHTDAPSPGGRLALDNGAEIGLKKLGEHQLQATWTLTQDALYHVRLQDHLKREARASEEYLMQAVADLAPSVRLTRPGRDLQPTPIEEVVIGFEGQDDVRLSELDLRYSVNGGPEQKVPLAQSSRGPEAAASHTVPLEDFSLVPGDLITYYGVAKDAAANTTSSEMFFLQVRPFERSYTQGQTGGGGGAGQGQESTFLSERQKEVISATWNVLRQKDKQRPDQIAEAAEVLSTVQRSLQEQAQTLATRIGRRELTGVNDEFSGLVENLEKAIAAMGPAAESLEKEKFQEALTPEQTALQYLLRAEALFRDIQVAFGNQQGGGGSMGGNSGRDLADLFSLELDTSKNQYETLSQFSSGQSNAEMQEAMRKLQELARRQEELARQERENRKDSMRAASRWEQEMLRRETEDLARRLEQLSQQRNSSQLSQAGRTLSQAARDMQQAGSPSGSSSSSSGSSERSRALERLREANNLLTGQQNRWDEEKLRQLGENAEDLTRLQEGIAEQTRRMAEESGRPSSSARTMREALERTIEDKIQLLEGLRDLERKINEAAARMAGSQKEATKDLRGASSSIQEERMADKIRQGAWLSQRGMWPTAAPIEEDLRAGLEQLRNRVQDAQRSFEQGGADDKLQQALQAAERVRQGLESMAGQQGRQGQQGQQAGSQGNNAGRPGENQQNARNAGDSQAAQGDPRGGSWDRRAFGNPSDRSRDGLAGTWAGRYRGEAWNPGGYTPTPPRALTPEEQRELDQRYRELLQEAAGLRELLSQDPDFGRLAQDLVRAMQNLDARRFPGDPEELKRLRAELAERWKELELRLRRQLQMEEPETVRLAGQERVPEKYRAIVEEYYRSLSRGKR